MKYLFGIFLLILALGSQAQEVTVTGTVTDASDGMPIPGVSVTVKGTTLGVITSFDGEYSLKANQGDVLTFSFIGLATQEVVVAGSVIDVKMVSKSEDLDEVVVVGYGVRKKALLTGANINVKGEEIASKNTSSAMEALQGVTPGISVTRNNGAPGAGTKVTIRGLGTIGNSSPLYIVDGVAVGNIDYLNASDIESIDVLKDAASAAIYGSRAANGVVLVTTKKGKVGAKPSVTYDAYYGIQNIYKTVPSLTAQEYMYIMDEGRRNDNAEAWDWESILKNNVWLNNTYAGNLGTQLGEDIWSMLESGWEGTDWVDEMTMSDAPMHSHAVNISGASEDIVYSFGFSYFDQSGLVGGDISDAGYRRLTARLNTEMVLFKNSKFDIVKIGENLTFTNIENRSVATGNIYWNDLHNAIVQNPLMPAYWDKSPDQNGYTPTLDGWELSQTNPLAKLYYTHNDSWGKSNSITGNVFAEIKPMKDLTFRSSLGANAWFGHSRSWSPTYGLGANYSNTSDAVQQDMYQGVSYTLTNTLNYEKQIGVHKIGVLLGQEALDNVLNMNVGGWKSGTDFGDPDYAYLDNSNPESITAINTWGADWAAQGGGLLSYMARLSYNYSEKYMLDVIVRADGSSNFAEGNRWGTFPSVSAGWNFTEESFMQDLSFIDYGKVRFSWGQNGNQEIDNFIYSANIDYINPGYYFGDSKPASPSTSIPANIPNPDVSWETSEQTNIGLDTRFIDSKLSFTFDWYSKVTKDWLVIAPTQGTSGADAPYVNGGDIKNSGFEFALSWSDNVGDFSYGATLSGTSNKNEVTRIDNAEGVITGSDHVLSQGTSYISRVEVGNPIGFFYGYKADGLLQNQAEVDAYNHEGNPYFEDQRPGDVRFVDQNNDGVIDESDKVKLGDPNPDFELGMQLDVEYKGVYANVTLTGKYGMQIMRSYRSFADQYKQNYTTEIFGRWHGEGTSTRLPRLSSSSHRNNQYISDIYMHDADYTRISNLTVGYKFNSMLKNVSWLNTAKVYCAVNNLYTFTNYDGMDPEVGFGHDDDWASGIDLGLYPLPRTVMFGVNLTF